jgi:hypothetical protein
MDFSQKQPGPPTTTPFADPAWMHEKPHPFRLSAITSLLLYIFILFGLWTIQQAILGLAQHPNARPTARQITPHAPIAIAPSTPRDNLIPLAPYLTIESVDFAALFFVSVLMAILEDRSVGVFGLGGNQSAPRFLHGAFWGLAAMSLLIGTLSVLHLVSFDARLLHGSAILGWGAFQLCLFLLVGLYEEYLFRGYLQFTLTRALVVIGNLFSSQHARAIAFWIAAFLTSAIFLFAHTRNAGENWLGLFQVFLAGILFVVALWRTGSLWWAIGFHMSWDWAQSFLYGVPDSGGLEQGRLFATHALGNKLYSGGTVGPEGSMLCCPIILLAIIVLLYTHPSPQPPLETRSDSLPPPPASLLPDNPAAISWD